MLDSGGGLAASAEDADRICLEKGSAIALSYPHSRTALRSNGALSGRRGRLLQQRVKHRVAHSSKAYHPRKGQGFLGSGNKQLDRVQGNCLYELTEGDGVIGIAAKHLGNDLIRTVNKLDPESISNNI